MAEEEKDDWLDDLDSDDGASELDQSDIESLLSGDDDEPAEDLSAASEEVEDTSSGEDSVVDEAPADEEAGEIDSADIDSLLSGTEDDEPSAPPQEASSVSAEDAGAGAEEESDIDQSDIDALLSETDSADEGDAVEDPDQNEIDMLFSEVDGDDAPEADPFQAEEIDFKDVIDSDQGEDESFMDGTGTAFDADEFGIDDDMPDIPELEDADGTEGSTALFDDADEATVASDEATVMMDSDGDSSGNPGVSQKISLLLAKMPPALQDRKIQSIVGGCLVLLLLVGVFLFGGEEEGAEEIAEQPVLEQPVVDQQTEQPEEVNTTPTVKDAEFSLTEGTELAIQLTAEDTEGDKLSYEILSLPEHGKLSGQAPGLIYIPSKDFSGQDSFMFRVSDGINVSQPANIKITAPLTKVALNQTEQILNPAPAPQKAVKARKKSTKPKKLKIAAKNKTYRLDSTSDILIDWEDLWSSANYLPFTQKVKVEIISTNLHGTLKRLGESQSQYTPDKYYGGKENIKYRFKLGKTRSKVRQLTMNVNLGTPPPTIKLAKMAKNYVPGETVVLDAEGSRDEKRDSVTFTWQQVSGVPVQLEFLNQEESQVAFIVPSSFNTVANPGPVIRLIATDEDGQKDVQDIKVGTRSKRASAMWRGLADGGIAEDPYCPYENCPGGLLPWPYGD